MRWDRPGWVRAAAILPLVVHSALASGQQGADEAQLKALRAQIIEMIGEASCVNLVHCRLLALGTRPCGGADEYLAYSSNTGNRTALENKALEYTLLQEDVQQAKGAVGVCVVLPQPRLTCIDRRCRVVGE